MASTYVNDLRLNEMATGDGSGTWGTTTNTNLELIAEAFSYGTEVITTNADTHTTTIADGATDPGRALYLKYTGTLDSACTITIGPNTVSKVWIIENGTSGSQDIILSQGSGANITIPAGDTKVVYSDGAGAGAAFFDAFASLSVVDLKVQDDLTVTGDIDVDGSAVINQYLTLKTTDDQVNGWVLYTGTTDKLEFNYNGSGNAEVVIDSTGNVGIGTAPTFTPGGSRILLQLTNGASGGQIAMGNNASESENPRIFSDADNLGFATATTGGGIFQFYTAGTEALRIDASGNVDITYGNLFTDTTSGIFFSGGIGSFTNGIYGVGVNNMAFNVNGSERARIDSSGVLSVPAGYYVGGTAAANLLDDYEEGAWTPVSKSDSTTIGTTVNFAKYVKIGSWVYVTAFVTRSDAASLTGNFTVEGLPYQPASGSAQVNGAFWFDTTGTDTVTTIYFIGGQSYVQAKLVGSSNDYATADLFQNSRPFYMSGSYMVAF
jgi:hypothetical protein